VDGGSPQFLASVTGALVLLEVDATTVYIPAAATIQTVPIGGTTLSTLGGFTGAKFAIDASDVYYADQNQKLVQKIPKSGGAPVTLANLSPATPDEVAIDATYVYFTTCNGGRESVIYKTPK
jgi:hypothetical protein